MVVRFTIDAVAQVDLPWLAWLFSSIVVLDTDDDDDDDVISHLV